MTSIKVWLQYPWKFPDSPYYKYLINSPPKNIKYLNVKKQKGVITNEKFFWFSNFLKRNIRNLMNLFHFSLPNAHLTKTEKGYDLIHCAHCLSKNKNKPWIMDIESKWQLYIGDLYIEDRRKETKNRIRKILLRKNCKKIIPWTRATAKGLIKEFPEIRNKVEVVYPAVPLPKIKRRKHKGINLLFVGRYFYQKGGLHALDVFDRLTKKYENVHAMIISEIPKEIKKKYLKNEKIKFYGLMSQKELFEEIYPISDILIYPGYSDTYGFLFMEAMSFGIPIITADGFARKEIIQEGKTGFVIDKPEKINREIISFEEKQLINKIVKKAERLIKNKKLREKMSRASIKIIENGKFSVKERNKKLEKIYREALGK